MTDRNRGGRLIEPETRPLSAPGVGPEAARHDLERRNVPFLQGSDLQQGDVEALQSGQRIAPVQRQEPATPERPGQPSRAQMPTEEEIEDPDPIDFLAEENGQDFTLPQAQRAIDNSRTLTWLPILRRLASGPGASSLFVTTLIDQGRKMQQLGSQPATVVDLQAVDDGIEAMLDEGVEIE